MSLHWRVTARPAAALLTILLGVLLRLQPSTMGWSHRVWLIGLILTGVPLIWRTARRVLRGRFAADIVATLAVLTAMLLGQPLAGLVVVLMQTGGEAFERYAEGRASEAVRELERRVPRVAHRLSTGQITDVDVQSVEIGDLLLIRPGEMVPCDGIVVDGRSHVDTASLTGEPIPLRAEPGVALMSGSLNQEGSLTLRTTAPAAESQYARIVELVRTAQATKAPIQRLADRYAVWFTPLTLAVCAATYLASGDPVRVLAVLVVATPCPLILATPVAVIGGINRAARQGIVFRSGTAIEQLSQVRVAVFDKTGTLTIGRPQVASIATRPPLTEREVLRLAAAVEQESGHLLARPVVEAAMAKQIPIPDAHHIEEAAGRGVTGQVEGQLVTIGAPSYLSERHPAATADLTELDGDGRGLRAFMAIDGRGAGIIEYADLLRPSIERVVSDLRREGVARTLLLSGDSQHNTDAVARKVGITEARGDLLPADKLAIVQALLVEGNKVLMVGDGTNDAPALSAASVGMALAAHGGGVSAEAAQVVLLGDDPRLIGEAMMVSRRTLRIARQSLWVGLGLSAVAMGFAAFGLIPPTIGALLQEAIDVTVILNAVRTSQ